MAFLPCYLAAPPNPSVPENGAPAVPYDEEGLVPERGDRIPQENACVSRIVQEMELRDLVPRPKGNLDFGVVFNERFFRCSTCAALGVRGRRLNSIEPRDHLPFKRAMRSARRQWLSQNLLNGHESLTYLLTGFTFIA
jgi:hypothetical protein